MARGRPRGLVPHSTGLSIHQQTLGLAMLGGRLVLAGRWRSGHPGPLVWDAVPGSRGERVGGPRSLGRSGRLQCSRQQALAESGLDRGWQGALAMSSWLRPQLLILFSTPP